MFKNQKLTESQVIEIMKNETDSVSEIANQYGVHRETIRKIFNGSCWGHLKYHMAGHDRNKAKHRKLKEHEVIEILQNVDMSCSQLAARYHVHEDTIRCIIKGTRWNRLHHLKNPNRPNDWTRRKLTEDVVRAIKNFEVDDFDALAKEYGVSVRYLKQFRNPNFLCGWKYIPVKGYEDVNSLPPKKTNKLSKSDVIAIYTNRTTKPTILARKYNVCSSTIYDILSGKKRTDITSNIQLEC